MAALQALLSGTFLQTLPEFDTPLRGHSYLRVPGPSEWFGYYYCTKKTGGGGGGRGNTAPKHAREHEARPPQTQEEFRLDSNNFGFICDGVVSVDSYTETPYALRWQFSQTYGRVTNN